MTTGFADRMRSAKKSFIKEILKVTEDPPIISFAGGLPNTESFPVEEVAAAAANLELIGKAFLNRGIPLQSSGLLTFLTATWKSTSERYGACIKYKEMPWSRRSKGISLEESSILGWRAECSCG
jgi:hypothetical protein